jgi:hypothetical protein
MEYDYLPHLTTEGIIFMIFGWGFVIGLVIFTFWKVLKSTTDLKKEAEIKDGSAN